jgi:hypothetical protein
MKTRHTFIIVLAVVAALLVLTTGLTWAMNNPAGQSDPKAPPATGFTYQGYLTDARQPANDIYDFYFELFDEETEGNSLGKVQVDEVIVEQGIFTVILDFGEEVFNGDPRWLEIYVRLNGGGTEYTLLEGRQLITFVPYAIYALESGGVDWGDIHNRPGGLDDGDQNTTYSAGTGLNLTGTTFNVMTDTLQVRLDGSCVAGSTIRAVNADGSLKCEPHDTRPVFNRNALDTTVDVGQHTSITIGADGLPVISYFDYYNGDLKVAHCNDSACATASTNVLDTTGDVGWNTSITIGADGLPVISYLDWTNSDLKVAHCNDSACSTASTNALDTTGDVGWFTSITIGVDGLPIISYYDYYHGNFKVAHCSNPFCVPYWQRR